MMKTVISRSTNANLLRDEHKNKTKHCSSSVIFESQTPDV